MSSKNRLHRRVLAIAVAGAALSSAARAQQYALDWWTIDGGGGSCSDGLRGGLVLRGTIGQPEAGALGTGDLRLTGGFWAALAAHAPCPAASGDANCDGRVDFFDVDPFVLALFDAQAYTLLYCDGATCSVDTDCSGDVNLFDIDPFVTCLFEGCLPCP